MEIKIAENATVTIRRDGEWTILHVQDGSGAQTTVSLTSMQAIDAAELLRGSGITAAGLTK